MTVARVTRGFDAINDNVATRADLREFELCLEARFEAVTRRIDGVVVRLGSLIVILTGGRPGSDPLPAAQLILRS